ncbi:MAG: toxin-antitoxin system YwqK family antitoxin [Phycisphaerae bacterium]
MWSDRYKWTVQTLLISLMAFAAACETGDDNGSAKQGTDAKPNNTESTDGGAEAKSGPVPIGELELPEDDACRNLETKVVETEHATGGIAIRQEVVKLPNGNLIAHGKTIHYWDNGQKKLEYTNVCGVRHGPKLAWHITGERWQEGAYAYNSDHGVWKEWFSDGQMSRRWTMDLGAWNGLYTEWHPNGSKRREVMWVNGQKQGSEYQWSEDGSQVKITEYVDGIEQP